MLYQHPDGLPDTILSGLNSKVDQLLKVGVVVIIGGCGFILVTSSDVQHGAGTCGNSSPRAHWRIPL